MERFEINRAKDFKTTIIKYLQEQMAHQQQVSLRIVELVEDEEGCFGQKLWDWLKIIW